MQIVPNITCCMLKVAHDFHSYVLLVPIRSFAISMRLQREIKIKPKYWTEENKLNIHQNVLNKFIEFTSTLILQTEMRFSSFFFLFQCAIILAPYLLYTESPCCFHHIVCMHVCSHLNSLTEQTKIIMLKYILK